MINFDAIREDRNEWQKQAKQVLVSGIDPSELKIGQRITISPNLIVGDRSYTRDIHEVLAINTSHVQTRIKRGYDGNPQIILLLAHEHYFYDASNFQESAGE